MKIAVTSQGASRNYHVNQRFGQTKYIVVYNTETDAYMFKSNELNLNATHRTAIKTVMSIFETGAEVLITGNCGPKALHELHDKKIRVFTGVIDSVKQAIKDYGRGMLKEVHSADVEEHWL